MIDYPILLVKSLIQECLASPIQRFLGDSLMFAQIIDASELFMKNLSIVTEYLVCGVIAVVNFPQFHLL